MFPGEVGYEGHVLTQQPLAKDAKLADAVSNDGTEDVSASPQVSPDSFREVFWSLAKTMASYRNLVPLTLALVPQVSRSLAEDRILGFARSRGNYRQDLSNDSLHVFEFDWTCFREMSMHTQQVDAAIRGSRQLSQVMIIGLISAYDAFLSDLLRVVFSTKPETVFTSDKTIRYTELAAFGSLDAAKAAIIDKEIESILRLSHHEQFERMQSLFSVTLRGGLDVWPDFIEVCERRNLFTHTGGVVSAQYLSNCEAHKVKLRDIKIGDQLDARPKYFAEAVRVVAEVSIKLLYVFWRKFSPAEIGIADKSLNELVFDLVHAAEYELAEALAAFGADTLRKYKGEERTRRMLVINLANALRLQKRDEEARRVLDAEDWSLADDIFQISLKAVRGDVDDVIALMRKNRDHTDLDKERYRSWPVFRSLHDNEKFLNAFQETFGEPFLKSTASPGTPEIGKLHVLAKVPGVALN